MSNPNRIDLRIDITDRTGLPGALSTAVSVFPPDPGPLPDPPIVVFGFPGGGYGRRYFDIEAPGFSGYSQAEHHRRQGFVFVACDHLGVGESSLPDPTSLTYENLALANKATVEEVMARLAGGELTPDLGPVRGAVRIGMGQSMGGCLLIVQQGQHATFDGVAILGYSAIHTVLPVPAGFDPAPPPAPPRGSDPATFADYPATAATAPEVRRYAFHWEDVPPAFVEPDMAGYPQRARVPMWGSATVPACARTMLSAGCVAEEARRIEAPVFIGVGERDVVPRPHEEPRAYARARDITLYLVPRMAHMHNFAGTRARLWDRLVHWARGVATSRA